MSYGLISAPFAMLFEYLDQHGLLTRKYPSPHSDPDPKPDPKPDYENETTVFVFKSDVATWTPYETTWTDSYVWEQLTGTSENIWKCTVKKIYLSRRNIFIQRIN